MTYNGLVNPAILRKREDAGSRQDDLMRIKMTVIAFTLAFATTGTLLASDIYRWTDDEGNVYFVDRPTGAPTEERLEIRSRPTNSARVSAEVQARLDEEARRAEEEATAPRGPSQEDLEIQARWDEEQCNKFRDRQIRFTQNRRIYRMDENGERVYYDEEEMQAARAKVDDLVTIYCN